MGRANEQFIAERQREQEYAQDMAVQQLTIRSLDGATVEGIEALAVPIIDDVQDGNRSALKVAAWMRSVKAFAETVLKEIEPEMLAEAGELDGPTEVNGWLLEPAEVGVKYDYSACADVEWDRMNDAEAELKKLKRDREKWLKLMPSETVDPETGNVVKPPIKTSKSSVKFSRPK